LTAIDLTAAGQPVFDYCRNVERELADFSAYFSNHARFDAVDNALLNFVRMRVEILSEHLDLVDRAANAPPTLLDVLRATNTACCDFLLTWAPQPLPVH
jgi:hypothetical protein